MQSSALSLPLCVGIHSDDYLTDIATDPVSGTVRCECMFGLNGKTQVFHLAPDVTIGDLHNRFAQEFDTLTMGGYTLHFTNAHIRFMQLEQITRLINTNRGYLQVILLKVPAQNDDSDTDGSDDSEGQGQEQDWHRGRSVSVGGGVAST